jgi:hypothetical protein
MLCEFTFCSAVPKAGSAYAVIMQKNRLKARSVLQKFVDTKKCGTFAPAKRHELFWRDGRVVDYTSLENWRAARHRGFESLSLRYIALLSSSCKIYARFYIQKCKFGRFLFPYNSHRIFLYLQLFGLLIRHRVIVAQLAR